MSDGIVSMKTPVLGPPLRASAFITRVVCARLGLFIVLDQSVRGHLVRTTRRSNKNDHEVQTTMPHLSDMSQCSTMCACMCVRVYLYVCIHCVVSWNRLRTKARTYIRSLGIPHCTACSQHRHVEKPSFRTPFALEPAGVGLVDQFSPELSHHKLMVGENVEGTDAEFRGIQRNMKGGCHEVSGGCQDDEGNTDVRALSVVRVVAGIREERESVGK